jgi:hypothetical protein
MSPDNTLSSVRYKLQPNNRPSKRLVFREMNTGNRTFTRLSKETRRLTDKYMK